MRVVDDQGFDAAVDVAGMHLTDHDVVVAGWIFIVVRGFPRNRRTFDQQRAAAVLVHRDSVKTRRLVLAEELAGRFPWR